MLIRYLVGEQNKQVLPSPNQLPCLLPKEYLFPVFPSPSLSPFLSPLSPHTYHTSSPTLTPQPKPRLHKHLILEHQHAQTSRSVCVQSKQIGVALGPDEEVAEVGLEAAPRTKRHSSETGLAVVETKLFHLFFFFFPSPRETGHSSWFWLGTSLALNSLTMARHCPVVPSRQ